MRSAPSRCRGWWRSPIPTTSPRSGCWTSSASSVEASPSIRACRRPGTSSRARRGARGRNAGAPARDLLDDEGGGRDSPPPGPGTPVDDELHSGRSAAPCRARSDAMADGKGPLKGIRVIDLGRHQAGPRCAQVLARLGAEVIKIERLGGEETRYHAPWVRKQSAYWVQYNSGKKSLSMDLRKEEGKTALRKLIKVSDVLVQNFRPGTMDEMGFGYDELKSLNPRIIMVNVSAYGQFGPYRDQIGYDPIGQTMSGVAMVTGEEGMPPVRAGVPIIDRTTALHSAIGTLAALHERSISGEGQSIDVCLADSGYSLTEIPITAYHGAGTEPQRGKSDAAPSGMYPCKDGWVLIAAGDQHHWSRVCDALA